MTPLHNIKHSTDLFPGSAHIANGYMVATEFGSTGGSESQTNVVRGPAGTSRMTKDIKHDHPELQKEASILVNQAYVQMWTHSVRTFAAMYFVPERDFATLDNALEDIRAAAEALNEKARVLRSHRETRIEIYRMSVDPGNLRLALRLGQVMHKLLVRLRETYDEVEVRQAFGSEWRMCQNLYKMVTGEQAELVRAALNSAKAQHDSRDARTERGQRLRTDRGTLDYGPIDRAIALFAPAADAFL